MGSRGCAPRGRWRAAAGREITLIDRTNHFLFQPLLYQVATGLLSGGQIAPALRGIFRRYPHVRVLLGEVEGFDLSRRVVRVYAEHEFEVPYDTLILAAGATHSYFGRDDWAVLAPGMKSIDDANRLRSMILGAFELAEAAETAARSGMAWMTFAIVGAGPTGVELAGQVAELAHRILAVRVPERRHVAGPDRPAGLQPAGPEDVPGEALSARRAGPAAARDRRRARRARGGDRPRGARRRGRRRAAPDHGQDDRLGGGREGLAAGRGARGVARRPRGAGRGRAAI